MTINSHCWCHNDIFFKQQKWYIDLPFSIENYFIIKLEQII